MVYELPLRGHDLVELTRADLDALGASRRKAKVHRVWTWLGPRWAWEHECRWKGYATTNSYPLASWQVALDSALGHLKSCP